MSIDANTTHALIEAVAKTIAAHEDELTALDSAIGDGDHGANMNRGLAAVLADAETLAAKPLDEAVKAAGMILVMKIGGASGPLYGTLFMALGKALGDTPSLTTATEALATAIEAVKARGKSDVGAKTMLDVLAPIHAALDAGQTDPATLKDVADGAARATIPMLATRGRASFLGERSIGHMDPGARSTALIFAAVADVLGEPI
ncbi:Phosphoenolpyruvate-dihydroxyacetone phosphotransferase, ADP-binding subunit DhaL [hydrothermal vent metagenome]|uniref:Phosphoenolpyruvate-dihydroxyacetone phosphotransferase, ADP-binding subunit DhaL n=1 Tax=hydrothermal vent metagenome TaxID=652676 RepID=A0A3B0TYA2_9ZZZZ